MQLSVLACALAFLSLAGRAAGKGLPLRGEANWPYDDDTPSCSDCEWKNDCLEKARMELVCTCIEENCPADCTWERGCHDDPDAPSCSKCEDKNDCLEKASGAFNDIMAMELLCTCIEENCPNDCMWERGCHASNNDDVKTKNSRLRGAWKLDLPVVSDAAEQPASAL